MHLSELVFSFSSDGTAERYGSYIFSFWENSILCSKWLLQFAFPLTVQKGSLCFTALPTLVISCLLITAILGDVRRYPTVVLICTSLMIKDAEYLFLYLLAICMSSLAKSIFRYSVHYLITFLFLFFGYWIVWALYIFWILTPYQVICKYFLSVHRLPIHFVYGFIYCVEAF